MLVISKKRHSNSSTFLLYLFVINRLIVNYNYHHHTYIKLCKLNKKLLI